MVRGDVGWNTTSGGIQASLSSQHLPAAASNSINDANDVLHALNPNPMHVPNVQHPAAHENELRNVEKITFGGYGKRKGKFLSITGVAVSADNEIFVTDGKNQRVQVFSIDGTLLRLFPTIVPGESTRMHPHGVASDVESGYLWVLGKSSRSNGHVVQYSKNGQPIKKFDVSLKSFYPVIAMNVRNNKVIVGDKTTIMMFDPNGSRIWSSKVPTEDAIRGVTSDKEGNVLLTDWHKTIQKYNSSGVKILEFGTCGKVEGQLNSPVGICLDTSGRIIVANNMNHRVDIFTSQGKFVGTIAKISYPWAVAMGPRGELVVTSPYKVTIFPRHMVLP
ncbi:PREDICTED: E3 ubiquitin-protein ligase TRIM71-like [Branchiostoma belcheri]|uniref:E3 ubiquitin-protein ligase TRIM71-like n=1 Tax=Branchiostoma belcheri TaxID=7741 RepID=A0A6P4YMQ6_BRABE|nr:PREDICTED: E3 ubiquitin-protein ligase TRIM71-like [Branchiostoma belcheri]